MTAGHSDYCQLDCLPLHSWFKVHTSLQRQLFPHVLALAFKCLDFSMKIKIVSDAWGRRKVRRRETFILLVFPSFHSAGQAESSGWESGWLLWGLCPTHRGLDSLSRWDMGGMIPPLYSDALALQRGARTCIALLNPSPRVRPKASLQRATSKLPSALIWSTCDSLWDRGEASFCSAGERMQACHIFSSGRKGHRLEEPGKIFYQLVRSSKTTAHKKCVWDYIPKK